MNYYRLLILWGHEVTYLVKALRYEPEGRVFDSQ